jgi:hypothetical protein
MLELKILILEFLTVDGLAACAIAGGKVATLYHKAFDNAVEGAAFIVEGFARLAHTFLARTEGAEVFGGFGNGWERTD